MQNINFDSFILEEDIKYWFPVAEPLMKKLLWLLNVLLEIVNDAILPPVNKTEEPVILPSDCKWNLEELISILPFEPLTNCASLPKKNLDVKILTFELLKYVFVALNTKLLVTVPSLPVDARG